MKTLFKHEEQDKGGGFDFYDFKNALRKEFGERIGEFLSMEFRSVAGEFLNTASRYSKLVDWCDNEIRNANTVIDTLSPVDKDNSYTTATANLWREQLHYVAELVYFRELLLDNRTTTKQRADIEYFLCKIYGIHYNESLCDYV